MPTDETAHTNSGTVPARTTRRTGNGSAGSAGGFYGPHQRYPDACYNTTGGGTGGGASSVGSLTGGAISTGASVDATQSGSGYAKVSLNGAAPVTYSSTGTVTVG